MNRGARRRSPKSRALAVHVGAPVLPVARLSAMDDRRPAKSVCIQRLSTAELARRISTPELRPATLFSGSARKRTDRFLPWRAYYALGAKFSVLDGGAFSLRISYVSNGRHNVTEERLGVLGRRENREGSMQENGYSRRES